MRFARDDANQLIDASQAVCTNKYSCPSCKETVQLKGGRYRRKHFAHVCSNHNPQQYNNKEHLAIQDEISQWFQEYGYSVVNEQRHREARRRADIAINESQLCIEVQCSPITVTEIAERTNDYHNLYENMCWLSSASILKQIKSDKFQLPAFILQKLYVQDNLYFFDVRKKKLIVLTNIIRISMTTILAEKFVAGKENNPFFLFTRKLKSGRPNYLLDKYLLFWQKRIRYKRKYAIMNYQLVHMKIQYEKFFSIKYRLPQIHVGIFNWQLQIIFYYFCCGITDVEDCILAMEKEKTIASRTEAIVLGITMFMKHLRELEQH
ncbi:competence protein CoiA [Culicoidibacter larvae]|uniref:Competence protein n=1 Tax=Culicoidibacter larvae TaxID=2579976 RepID=A0A5R8QBW1_9FIRM|nr:competence protein CoiA family protein [Culicoidibacter larvae]TLG73824.1 hypothetical protein FEZ08_06735 [Culicoidibacter larvae]